MLGRLGRGASSLVVFAALGGLLAWGHHTDWTMPKFSSLAGHEADDDDDGGWCSEHHVPESQCVECNPGLMPKPKTSGWCKRHEVPECPLCDPEVAQTRARPQTAAPDAARAARPELASRPANNSKCTLHGHRIQFVSQEAVERSGIEVAPVCSAPLVETVTGSGDVTYDQTRTARLSVRAAGSIFRVDKQAGDLVRQGEIMALVDAAEVGRAKSEFLQALADSRLKNNTFERLSSLSASGAVPERALREAETQLSESGIRLTAAQQALTNLGLPISMEGLKAVPADQLADRLRFLGLPKRLADTFDAKTTGNLLPVTAPLDGVVVSRDVVAGEVVDNHKVLFVVADVRKMWLLLDLRLEDARHVALGQEVRFRPDGGEPAGGQIAWISTEADQKTRTVKVRALLDNRQGRLRANTFGTGEVILHRENSAVVVPNTAVQWEGCCHVVFVRDKNYLKDGAPKVFHVRTVRPGAGDDQQTEILAGLLPGEIVVTRGSSLLRAELLKDNLGEGCTCCKK
jgi:cobalt-zinc-cadmium efflux system membrane fusion protein